MFTMSQKFWTSNIVFILKSLHHSTRKPRNRYHIRTNNLQLTAADINKLLSIIVDNTYFTQNGNTNEQITGLPMGSSTSNILAISYMDQLERRALSICPSCTLFSRYIDNILMLTSSSGEANAKYEKFQNIDTHIQFKIEHPDNTGSLSLVDFKTQISPAGKIYTSFYWKAATKNLFVYSWEEQSIQTVHSFPWPKIEGAIFWPLENRIHTTL